MSTYCYIMGITCEEDAHENRKVKKGHCIAQRRRGAVEIHRWVTLLTFCFVTRAKIIIMAAKGASNKAIAKKLGYTPYAVGLWRQRFLKHGLAGLHDELRCGRPRSISDEQVAELIRKAIKTRPLGRTNWTIRSMAEEIQISHQTVKRIWNAFGLLHHRQRHFKISSDPFFVEKVRDIVGLYLNPPNKAMVLCADEKSQIQALDCTQPVLPMGLGYVEDGTHDYVHHGTTTLIAALDIATGQVLTRCKCRHRHQEYLGFLKHIEANVPEELDIHLVVDNYSTHEHPRVKRWLALHLCYLVHFTPTYSLWLNQVEIWFNRTTQQAIRRGTFRSVKDLVSKIDHFVPRYNAQTKPFVWTVTAESILDKVKRLCQVISVTQH